MEAIREDMEKLIDRYPELWELVIYNKDEVLHFAGAVINENYFS